MKIHLKRWALYCTVAAALCISSSTQKIDCQSPIYNHVVGGWTDYQLAQMATASYSSGDCLSAVMLIYAYAQRGPTLLYSDSTFHETVSKDFVYCRDRIESAMNTSRQGGPRLTFDDTITNPLTRLANPQDFLTLGNDHYGHGDYFSAVVMLYAYAQSGPGVLQMNKGFQAQFWTEYDATVAKVRSAVASYERSLNAPGASGTDVSGLGAEKPKPFVLPPPSQ